MGTVVFLGIKTVITSSEVSIAKLKGIISSAIKSSIYSLPDPESIAA